MGCAPSSETPVSPRKGIIRRGSIFKREKVSLKIDKNVGLTKGFPQVIFVFGGPGSGRGKILSDAAEAFGLVLLNMERILIDSLYKIMEEEEDIDPWKRSNSLQKLVKAKPELLRVDFVLKQLTNKLKTLDSNRCYLVDFMPNLKFILMSNLFIKECNNELRNFETMYPVSFAIHLAIPPDKYEKKKKAAQCAQAQPDKPKQNEGTKQSDEADTSRTSKRFTLHHNSLKHFLDYYSKHDKLVTLDVSSGDTELIWERICELFDDVNLTHERPVNTIVLFVFDENELEKMNIGRFQIQVVSLCDIVNDEKDEPVKLLQSLCKYIDKCHPTQKAFAVNLAGTSITSDIVCEEKKKNIMFYDIGKTLLESHLIQFQQTKAKPVPVQSVVSVDNEIYLFQPEVPVKFCIWVAEQMKACRT